MSTPELKEDDPLDEHAIEQIMQQIARDRKAKCERPLSQAALRILAKKKLEHPEFGLAENKKPAD